MQVSKKIPFEQPEVLLGVRTMYIASNVIIAALYFYVYNQINQKKELKTLKYVEPAPMGSSEEPRPVVTTIQDYDKQQLRSQFKSQLMGVAMMCVMHLYFKYTNPLVIQSIIPLKSALEASLVKIHVFGQPAKGDLERPWKAAGGFMGMGQSEVKSDKATVESAEKSWRGGAKDE
ncbi:phosphate transporter (Pho88) [Ophidiomyces ophidiicola]|uniref:phosphate transporter (Pho88) n=1 Tax=Ophidiomyces ophidiicola TaxID=1387563 RepID=UPI0020C3B975|nr:phosphate transporter (Pho88) [Ophidiomyces ophidiicola]KAI1918425.1 phosphate transporter (Pho88) [Ophidiomyces ophidiicola]KAI1943788.1 phosphate transporter (Pho88) [Ophidiomyces ophidiicola]KAI1952763.1 phosphate transporter (Pho88) [Ophidiomyces ophidiicola]KAI1965782.1 phosphate transporter (Pho88) [Ophidiomyces ophidiicola]KAI2060871.1 phosphate transporter (Pho88) [Ophidiomyces ophidiicola]